MPSGRSGGSSRTSSSRSSSSSSSRTSSSRGSSSGSSSSHSSHRGGSLIILGGGWRGRGGHSGDGINLSPLSILCVFLMIICIFAGFIGLAFSTMASNDIRDYETEYIYYQDMLTSRVDTRDARVVSRFKNDKGNKWWFEYVIIPELGDIGYGSSLTPRLLEGVSFPIYEFDELPAADSIITVVLNATSIDLFTDSVPDHFDLTKIENDGDYIAALASKTICSTIIPIGFIAAAGLLVLIFVIEAKAKKKVAKVEEKKSATASATTTAAKPTCAYCGARISAEDKKCSNCGASNNKY